MGEVKRRPIGKKIKQKNKRQDWIGPPLPGLKKNNLHGRNCVGEEENRTGGEKENCCGRLLKVAVGRGSEHLDHIWG